MRHAWPMSTPIPMPLRAAAGLAAVAIDEIRRLPDQLVSLPVLAVGTAMQASLKLQQRYAELVARGDQLLGQLRRRPEGTPSWARFDGEEAAGAAAPEEALPPEQPFASDEAFAPEVALTPDEALAAEEALTPEEASGPGGAAEVEIGDGLVEANAVSEAGVRVASGTAAGGPGEDLRAEEEIVALAADAAAYDGYLATEPPLAGYDTMSIPQLRARLRQLSARELEELISYERSTTERAAYLTMLENRLATIRSQ
jgi:hypothetical protein